MPIWIIALPAVGALMALACCIATADDLQAHDAPERDPPEPDSPLDTGTPAPVSRGLIDLIAFGSSAACYTMGSGSPEIFRTRFATGAAAHAHPAASRAAACSGATVAVGSAADGS